MKEETKNVEMIEVEEETQNEKAGVLTRVKDSIKKHKKGIIAGAITGVAALVGFAIGRSTANDYEDDQDTEDYVEMIEVESEEVEDSEVE